MSYEALAWTAEWYFRLDTLEAANAAIVNYHHQLPFAQAWPARHRGVGGVLDEYLGLAVTVLRSNVRRIDDETLAHVWPTHHENVRLYGTHTVDIEGDLAGLDANSYRPYPPMRQLEGTREATGISSRTCGR